MPSDDAAFPVLGAERAGGLLLHVTSLPGEGPIGDLGAVELLLDWMQAAGLSVWQVLPLTCPGHGGSPYDSRSAFATDPRLLSAGDLAAEGLLPPEVAARRPAGPSGGVDLRQAAAWAATVAGESLAHGGRRWREPFAAFREEQAEWLPDWTLYTALRERLGRPWTRWPEPLRRRDAAALAAAGDDLEEDVERHAWAQFLVDRQWRRVREMAAARGIRLFGDLPIYVAADSADAWASREVFQLDGEGRPEAVAGVPPDLFSRTGQLWGNPLYDWDRLAADGYSWWRRRLARELSRLDLLRLDHFRGFAAYWRVPAGAETAEGGEWVPGPGRELFAALARELGDLPLVAEDLGMITDDVRQLRRGLGLPGMRVLQFGFGDGDSEHLPHRHEPLAVVYTGTHDNPTTVEWWAEAGPEARRHLATYLGDPGAAPHQALLRAAWASVAQLAVAPLQDLLGLGAEARMNVPGVAEGNWTWRARPDHLAPRVAEAMRRLGEATARVGGLPG